MANMPAGLQPPCVVNVAGVGATCRLVYSQRVWSMWLAYGPYAGWSNLKAYAAIT